VRAALPPAHDLPVEGLGHVPGDPLVQELDPTLAAGGGEGGRDRMGSGYGSGQERRLGPTRSA